MMTTCRLLCALLVLALCCCPLLCVAQDSEKVQVPDATLIPTGLSSSTEGIQAKVQSGPSALPVTKPAEKPGEDAGAGQRLTGASPKTDEAASALQEQGDKGTTGLKSDNNKSAVETDQDAEASAQTTTTTTTKAPTTTTTTTTTEAPTTTTTKAPSTTTTEAPTSTTTRAPSRLREIDGSLSSSAWVCASLLLAASALAFTTVV
ncbi:putative mucin TcMUCII [Trypanosoma cruzi]|nr:putative mucin TcMUCII [Trypanosoma cruzi]